MSTDKDTFTSVPLALQHWCRATNLPMSAIAHEAGFMPREWDAIVNGRTRLDGIKVATVAAALNVCVIDLGRVLIADYNPEYVEQFDATIAELVSRGVFPARAT